MGKSNKRNDPSAESIELVLHARSRSRSPPDNPSSSSSSSSSPSPPIHPNDQNNAYLLPSTYLSVKQQMIGLIFLFCLLIWLLITAPPKTPNRIRKELHAHLLATTTSIQNNVIELPHHVFLPAPPKTVGLAFMPRTQGVVLINSNYTHGGIEWLDLATHDFKIPFNDGESIPLDHRFLPIHGLKHITTLPGSLLVVGWSAIDSHLYLLELQQLGHFVPISKFRIDNQEAVAICAAKSLFSPSAHMPTYTVALVQKSGTIIYFAIRFEPLQQDHTRFIVIRSTNVRLHPGEVITSCTISPLRLHTIEFATTYGTLATINLSNTPTPSPIPIITGTQWDSPMQPGTLLLLRLNERTWPVLTNLTGTIKHKQSVSAMVIHYAPKIDCEVLVLAHRNGLFTFMATSLNSQSWWLITRFTIKPTLMLTQSQNTTQVKHPKGPKSIDLTTSPMGPQFLGGLLAVHSSHPNGFFLYPFDQLIGTLRLANEMENLTPFSLDKISMTNPSHRELCPHPTRQLQSSQRNNHQPSCTCFEGYTGPNCTVPFAKCAHAGRISSPGVCDCIDGWTGYLCTHVLVPAAQALIPQLKPALDNDDTAIYIHPSGNTKASVIFGSTKKSRVDSGVHCWFVHNGVEIAFMPAPNNLTFVNSVSVLYQVPVQSLIQERGAVPNFLDVLVVSVRGDVNGVVVWGIDPEAILSALTPPQKKGSLNKPVIVPLHQSVMPLDTLKVYGSCAFTQPNNNNHVILPTKEGFAHQYQLILTSAIDNPKSRTDFEKVKPALLPVQHWRVGYGSQLENCVYDMKSEVLYIGEESIGVWAHRLNATMTLELPASSSSGSPQELSTLTRIDKWPRLIDTTMGVHVNGSLDRDVEGMDILYLPRTRLLIVSSQGSSSFVFYNITQTSLTPRLVSIKIGNGGEEKGPGRIDEVTFTDSFSVTSQPIGPYTRGVLVVHDDVTTKLDDDVGRRILVDSNASFKVVDLDQVYQRVLNLTGVDLLN